MKKIILNLIKISNILNILACKLQEICYREEFYVYVPNNNKPKYKHNTFESARKEAERLAEKLSIDEDIEVLQVVYKTKGYQPPF